MVPLVSRPRVRKGEDTRIITYGDIALIAAARITKGVSDHGKEGHHAVDDRGATPPVAADGRCHPTHTCDGLRGVGVGRWEVESDRRLQELHREYPGRRDDRAPAGGRGVFRREEVEPRRHHCRTSGAGQRRYQHLHRVHRHRPDSHPQAAGAEPGSTRWASTTPTP